MKERHRPSGRNLWRNPEFLKLWSGQSVSFLGSQVSSIALLLTAALHLDATPGQMGVLAAAGSAPYLFLSLFAGAWIDRLRKRPILLSADLGRVALLAAIPALYFLDALHMAILIGIAFAVGTLTMLFELACQPFLPSLLERETLVDGNSKLMASRAMADIAGPGIAGALVQAVSALFALLLDALSFVLSASCLWFIGRDEPTTRKPRDGQGIRQEVVKGLRVTVGSALLRAGALSAASYNLFWNVIEAVLVLYVVRQLELSVSAFGFTFAIGAVGALIGSLLSGRVAERFGVGPTIVGSAVLSCSSLLLIPLVSGASSVAPLLGLALFLRGLGLTGWNIQIQAFQQAAVQPGLLARMNSSYLLLSLGAGSVGALLGGALGGAIGLRRTVLVGAVGISTSWIILVASPFPTLRRIPDALEEETHELKGLSPSKAL